MRERSSVVSEELRSVLRVNGCKRSDFKTFFSMTKSDKLYASGSKQDHFNQQPTMPPSINIGAPISSRSITNGHLDNFKI